MTDLMKHSLRRLAALGLLTAGLLCGLAGITSAQNDTSDTIETTRATLEKWVETRRVISKERANWAADRETLKDRIEVLKREIEEKRKAIETVQEQITKVDQVRDEKVAANEKSKQTTEVVIKFLTTLEERTRAILVRLPEPIRERVKALSQSIPKDDEERKKVQPSERFRNVVGILNDVNKFNREITTTPELRSLPDGTTAQATTVYLGIGQGFYATANSQIAGIGTATKDGWIWTPENQSAAEISRMIAVLNGEQVAAFIRLPVSIFQER